MKKIIAGICTHGYFFMTLLGILLFFGVSSQGYEYEFILAFGCHTTVYPFFGLLMAWEAGLSYLAIGLLIFWALYLIAFVAGYVVAIRKQNYTVILVAALIDVLFSIGIIAGAISSVGFYDGHVPMLVGIVTSLLMVLGLGYLKNTAKKEMLDKSNGV